LHTSRSFFSNKVTISDISSWVGMEDHLFLFFWFYKNDRKTEFPSYFFQISKSLPDVFLLV